MTSALVCASARFVRTPDDVLWSSNQSLSYRFWERYLHVYDCVHLLVRTRTLRSAPADAVVASGEGVKILPVPDYRSMAEYVARLPHIWKVVRNGSGLRPAVHLRVPCELAAHVLRAFPPGRPFGLEVVGDPLEAFSPGAFQHPLRPLFAWFFARQLRWQCGQSAAVAYVNQRALPLRYPSRVGALTTHYSSVDLPEEAFAAAPRLFSAMRCPRLVFVGTLSRLYKGQDVLIDAVARCVRRRLDLRLRIVGDGRYREYLMKLAERESISARVEFLGQLSTPDAVRRVLDQGDLFVLPSRTEGLPRALVEAMARGLPCVGSAAGGIPELLDESELVPAGNSMALADKIAGILGDPSRMTALSARNLRKAREYAGPILAERRRKFYQYVRDITAEWDRTRSARRAAPTRSPIL